MSWFRRRHRTPSSKPVVSPRVGSPTDHGVHGGRIDATNLIRDGYERGEDARWTVLPEEGEQWGIHYEETPLTDTERFGPWLG